jgi:hypothetical protein
MRTFTMLLLLSCGGFKQGSILQDDWEYESTDPNDETVLDNGNDWLAGLQVVNEGISSASIQLRWNSPANINLNHYQLQYTDKLIGNTKEIDIDPMEQSYQIVGIKSDSEYDIELAACLDDGCSAKIASQYNQISTATGAEIWKFQGTGNTLDELERIYIGEDLIPTSYISPDNPSIVELYSLSESILEIWRQEFYSEENISLNSVVNVEQQILQCLSSNCDGNSLSSIQVINSSGDSTPSLLLQGEMPNSNPVLYQIPLSEEGLSCQFYDNCNSEIFFETSSLELQNFQFLSSSDPFNPILILEAQSECSTQQGFFVATQINMEWSIEMDISGCPRVLLENAIQPSVYQNDDYVKLYFRSEEGLEYIYATVDEQLSFASWEPTSAKRTVSFQWPDGTDAPNTTLDSLSTMHVLYSTQKYIFVTLPPSNEQSGGVGLATLINP